MHWTTQKRKEGNVRGRLGFREAEEGASAPNTAASPGVALREEGGPEVLKKPFQAPTSVVGREKFSGSQKGTKA